MAATAKRLPRNARAKRKPGAGFPGWLGLLFGLAAGLGVAGLIYFKDHATEKPIPAIKASKHKPHSTESSDSGAGYASSGPGEESGREPAPSYDFYDRLPKFEVVVPEKERDVKPDIRAVPETRRGTYVLQAGSYKNFADADRIRAQLALQGVESKVQKVSVDSDTWHRIRIGPITKLDELNRLRTILRKADIDVLVIRVGD
jgi:cell division protein FtsN